MKKIYFFTVFILISCVDNTREKTTIQSNKQIKLLLLGEWNVDSVSKADLPRKRFNDSSNIQILTIKKDAFEAKIISHGEVISNRTVGKWLIENDSLFVYLKRKAPEVSYKFNVTKTHLTLSFLDPMKNLTDVYLSRLSSK